MEASKHQMGEKKKSASTKEIDQQTVLALAEIGEEVRRLVRANGSGPLPASRLRRQKTAFRRLRDLFQPEKTPSPYDPS